MARKRDAISMTKMRTTLILLFALAGCATVPSSDRVLSHSPKLIGEVDADRQALAACLYENAYNLRGFKGGIFTLTDYSAEILYKGDMTQVEWRIIGGKESMAIYQLTGSNPTNVSVFWKHPPGKSGFRGLPYQWLEACK